MVDHYFRKPIRKGLHLFIGLAKWGNDWMIMDEHGRYWSREQVRRA